MSLSAVPTPVVPGEASVVLVQLTNGGAQPTAYVLRAVGLADDWVDPPTATDVLAPGATVEVPFVVRLPHGFPVSRQVIGIVAEPLRGGDVERCSIELLVGELDGVSVEVRPLEVRGGDKGRFSVHLDNHHPATAQLSLEGLAPESRVRVAFDRDQVVLPGGASVVVRGRLRGGRPFAGRGRRLPFVVRVGGAAEPVHIEGGFTQTPVLSSNVLKVVAVIAVLGLWVGALAVGLGRITADDDDDLAGSETAGEVVDADGDGVPDADGDGSGDGGGDAGGGDAGAEEDAEAEAAEEAATGTKVGGTVEAADPGGVTVRIEPVQGSDEDVAKAALVDVPDSITRGKRVGQVPQGLDQVRTAFTDDTGQWAFEGLRSPAYYLITFSKAGYSPRSFVVQATDGEPIALDVILEAGNGTVSGVVIDESGTPIGGADVTVTDGDTVLGVRTASTGDGVGQFTVGGMATPGTFLVTATRDGYGTESTAVDLEGSGSAGGLVLRMTEGVGSLDGRVTGVDGPLGNATVTVSNDDGSVTRTATTLTDAPVGTYRLPGLPIPGDYLLTIEASGYSTSTQRVTIDGAETVDVELQEITGRLTGLVTVDALDDSDEFEDGDPLSGVGVTLTADGVGFKTTTVDAPVPGTYELDGIPAGTYVATFQRFGFQSSTLLVTIGSGQEIVLDATINERPPEDIDNTSEIRATLSTTGSLPATPGTSSAGTATIVNAPPGSTFALTADIDAAARSFAFTALPPGVYRIRIDANAHEQATITVNVPSGQVVNITPQIIPWGSASGLVLSDPSGTAIAGATVTLTSSTVAAPAPFVTGADGAWSYTQALPAADYTLTVTHPDHVPSAPLAFTISPGETEPAITTSLVARQVLNVTVTDVRTGQPLDGARVRLYQGVLTDTEPPASTTAPATCGSIGSCDLVVPVDSENGTVTFPGLVGGTDYTGYATMTDRRTGRFTIRAVDRRTDTRLLPLASTTGSGVTGVVQFEFDTDPTRPVEGATVTVTGTYRTDPATGADITESRQTTTNSSGGFAITYANLPIRGNASVTVTHPSFDVPAGSQPIVFDPTDPTPGDPNDAITPTVLNPVRLSPRDATVSGSVLLSPGPLVPTTPVVTVLTKPSYAGTVTGTVVPVGGNRFTIRLGDAGASTPGNPEVRPGTYSFRVTANDYVPAEVTVCVPVPNLATSACPGTFPEVVLLRNGVIDVSVTSVIPGDTSGAAPDIPDGTVVVLRNASGTQIDQDTTVGGDVRFSGLTPGVDYSVSASRIRHRADSGSTTDLLIAGETEVIALQLESLGAISGTVRGEDTATSTVALPDPVSVRATTTNPPASCTSTTPSEACFTRVDPAGDAGYLIEGGADAPFGLVNGTWDVQPTTSVAGYGPAVAQSIVIDPTTRTPTANFVLPALPGDLFGTVTVTGNAAIEGILVTATPEVGTGATVSTTTEPDGSYRIPDLRHGTYTVRFGTGSTEVREVVREGITISKGVDRRLDETLVSLSTTINVLASATHGSGPSQPLEGATVKLFRSGTTTQVGSDVLTDENGAASFPGLGNGGYRVELSMLGYVSPPPDSVTAEGGFEDVVFNVRSVDRPTSIRIVSQAEATEGIPNIPVTFTPTAASPGRPTITNVITGATGLATTTLPHGTYTVSIGPAAVPAPPAPPPPLHGTTLVANGLDIAPTNTPDPVAGLDYQIAEARVTAAVSVAGGTPTEVLVVLRTGGATGAVREQRRLGPTGGTAEFFVPASTANPSYTVIASVEGDSTFAPATGSVGAVANGATASTAALTVNKQASAAILVRDPAGTGIANVAVTFAGQTLDTGSNGLVVFNGLAPGTYAATAVEPGYSTTATTPASVTIAAGQVAGTAATPNQTITMTGNRQHRVVVRDAANDLLSGVDVTLAGQTVRTSGSGSNAGQADFENLAPGTYTLTIPASATHQAYTDTNVVVSPTQVRDPNGNTRVRLTAI